MTQPLRILITGASGCAGLHLSALALERGASVAGFARRGVFADGVSGYAGDITEPEQIRHCLLEYKPDWIFHLAALVHGSGTHTPQALLRVNIEGTQHLLDTVRQTVPEARVLVASSSGIYGQPDHPEQAITEDTPLQARSTYALSKAAQDLMAAQYFLHYGVHTVRGRTFNQTGPGEPAGLVCAMLARQVARIEAGLQAPVLQVVTLQTRRDFCDVRDVVAGYWAALEYGVAGAAYNICSGRSHSIGQVAAYLMAHAGLSDRVQIVETHPDPLPQAILHQVGDATRLVTCSGWQANIPLEQSLRDLLDEWRVKINHKTEDAA
ncbi:MAG: GDP-mannose 4,6-dehydratase [Pseudomonadota bacterium]